MKLSVVMPSFNQGRFLARALDSVISQHKDGNLELIVRDAMSTDETASLLERHHEDYLRVYREPDAGQSDALAKGFEDSAGDILCWLNSDDMLLPGAVDRVLSTFKMNPDAEIVFGGAVYVDCDDKVIGRYPVSYPTLNALRNRCVLSQPSVFFRRETYNAVGGVNARLHYCMDYELWTRFAVGRRAFVGIAAPLSATRIHDQTKTFNGGLEFIDEICAMQKQLLGDVAPIWRVYQLTRQRALSRIRSKPLRFLTAGWRTLRRDPTTLFSLATALYERSRSEIIARLKHA